jgi:hypothetical protein
VHGRPDLAGHPDTVRWNARYRGRGAPSFAAHPLVRAALALPVPAGPVLDLASGPSGSVLLAAESGRLAVAVDASDVALDLLGREVARLGLAGLVSLVHADLKQWRPEPGRYAVVLCTGYWDALLFPAAAAAVARGGLLGWEAFTAGARQARPRLPADWCLADGEPASLLPGCFELISQQEDAAALAGPVRRMLARRCGLPAPAGRRPPWWG